MDELDSIDKLLLDIAIAEHFVNVRLYCPTTDEWAGI